MLFTKKELINMLKVNNLTQPKAKYSNNTILKMLACLDDSFIANVEETRTNKNTNSHFINRGSLVECIIKSVVYGQNEVIKSKQIESDLNTLDLDSAHLKLVDNIKSNNIEIKFSTSFAPATHKSNKARYTIIACEHGVYMMLSKNLVYTKAGKLNINNQCARDLKHLTELENLLGYGDNDID